MQDPFHLVKEDVQQTLKEANALYEHWKNLLTNTNTAENKEFIWVQKELENKIQNIVDDLDDLDETIEIVEKNIQKYELEDDEIQIRKSFIAVTRKRVKSIKDEIKDNNTKSKIERDNRSILMARKEETKITQSGNKYSKLDNDNLRDNNDFINENNEQQKLIMAEQDIALDTIGDHIQVIKVMSGDIGNELENQSKIMDEVDYRAGDLDTKLRATQKRLNTLIKKTKGYFSYCAIGALLILLVVLLYFLIKNKSK